LARTDEGEVRYASVFREHWRDRQSAATRTGELITQPGWIDAGIAALCALLAAGTLAAGTITLARTEALPAVAQGASVSAVRTGGSPLPTGLQRPGATSAGELLLPAGRQRLISALLPRLW
jgi:hypothetical protein